MIPDTLTDPEAEESLLGCLLLGLPEAQRPDLLALLPDAGAFTSPARKAVYAAWVGMPADTAASPSATAFRDYCRAQGTWGAVDGAGEGQGYAYLSGLADLVATPKLAPHYAATVADRWHRRQLWLATSAGQQMVGDLTRPLTDLLPEILSKFSTVGGQEAAGTPTTLGASLYEPLDAMMRQDGSVLDSGAIPTGLTDLDALLGGYAPGRLIVVAARPNAGKSAFATAAALTAAQHGPVWFWSLEMSRAELIPRLVSTQSGVNLRPRSGRKPSDIECAKIAAAAGQLHHLPITLDDATTTIPHLRAHLAALPPEARPKLLIADYLQLIESPKGTGYERRDLEVAAVTRQLKRNVAREFGIPVLACAQLKRLQEAETPREPRLDDLRESGAIEQDADQVVMLHYTGSEDGVTFQADEGRRPGWGDAMRTQLLVRKNRHGPKGMVNAFYDRSCHRWGDWSAR